MPDEPIIVVGGSLNIETQKGKLKDKGDNGRGGNKYEHPSANGTLKSVEIDGRIHPVSPQSVIRIHYDVPGE